MGGRDARAYRPDRHRRDGRQRLDQPQLGHAGSPVDVLAWAPVDGAGEQRHHLHRQQRCPLEVLVADQMPSICARVEQEVGLDRVAVGHADVDPADPVPLHADVGGVLEEIPKVELDRRVLVRRLEAGLEPPRLAGPQAPVENAAVRPVVRVDFRRDLQPNRPAILRQLKPADLLHVGRAVVPGRRVDHALATRQRPGPRREVVVGLRPVEERERARGPAVEQFRLVLGRAERQQVFQILTRHRVAPVHRTEGNSSRASGLGRS